MARRADCPCLVAGRGAASIYLPCAAGLAGSGFELLPTGQSPHYTVVDITAGLNDEDHTGFVWTFLDEARDPAQITPGTIVHLMPLPGLVEDYQALAARSLAG